MIKNTYYPKYYLSEGHISEGIRLWGGYPLRKNWKIIGGYSDFNKVGALIRVGENRLICGILGVSSHVFPIGGLSDWENGRKRLALQGGKIRVFKRSKKGHEYYVDWIPVENILLARRQKMNVRIQGKNISHFFSHKEFYLFLSNPGVDKLIDLYREEYFEKSKKIVHSN